MEYGKPMGTQLYKYEYGNRARRGTEPIPIVKPYISKIDLS